MSITEYGKMLFKGKNNKLKLIQPKSYTDATKAEQAEVLELLMKGEYVMVQVAMPISTIKGDV